MQATLERTALTGLHAVEALAIQRFAEWLLRTMPEQVDRLILFGSGARGETRAESDVDLLLVLKQPTPEQREAVADYTWHVLMEHRVDLAVVTYSREQLAHWLALGTPFARNVADEGIALIGEGITVGEGKSREVVAEFLRSAHEHLQMADMGLGAGLYRRCVSEAYYAFLDAADAALVARGIRTKSHSGTIDLFGLHFVKPGLIDAKFADWFRKIRKDRIDADYERMREFSEAEAREALARAKGFVHVVESLTSTVE